MKTITRRNLVQSLVAGAVVLGFDPVSRSWVTTASAAGGSVNFPGLDGLLLTDATSRAAYAHDFGNTVHRTPLAVLKPGSVHDVEKAVKFCRNHDIAVAARGQGHSTFGQSQVQGGLLIDMSTLSQVEEINDDYAVVQAGAIWQTVLEASLPLGLSPPVLTGYVGLSVGGTLSMGGVSGMSYQRGAQVHNVLELDVVTGKGKLVTCSLTENQPLFKAMLGGQGQCGIIVRAKLPMVPNPPLARNYLIRYTDSAVFFQDMFTLISRGEVGGVYATVLPNPLGGWVYELNVVQFFVPGNEPDDAALLANLAYPPAALQALDMPALVFHLQVTFLMDFLKSIGQYDVPHIWGDVYLPASQTQTFVEDTLAAMTPADVGTFGFVLLIPVCNHSSKAPAFRLPNEDLVFLFDVLTAGYNDPEYLAAQTTRTRAMYEDARDIGGKLYPIGSTPMSHDDWVAHYGAAYPLFRAAKRAYDPRGIMTPGPGIFDDDDCED